MQRINFYYLLFITLSIIFSGCSNLKDRELEKDETDKVVSNSEKVANNAKLALQQCGKGNINRVTIDGFECKNNNIN